MRKLFEAELLGRELWKLMCLPCLVPPTTEDRTRTPCGARPPSDECVINAQSSSRSQRHLSPRQIFNSSQTPV
ncbi:Endochitinase [Clarias magur]|uniref:Endochitinase n=1 Tax=Clarias magur TaxID=1594786 RepID=A0A8J4TSZ0_CLAMG|nr:Endochitinase [Clarias magur]